MSRNAKQPAGELPPNVVAKDSEYGYLPHEQMKALGLDFGEGWPGHFTFYLTERFGWVLTTLPISGGKPPRTYGIAVNGENVVTVGKGPHVLKIVEVFFKPDNADRLNDYVRLWRKGMAEAGKIRDRVSSRRAEGQQRRAAGQQSWRWDS